MRMNGTATVQNLSQSQGQIVPSVLQISSDGWAWGGANLKDGVAMIDATVGAGKVYLFGPQITFRAQPHGTFKFLFNALYLSALK